MVLDWRLSAYTVAHSWEKSLETFIYCKDCVTQLPHYEDAGEKFLPKSHAALEKPVCLFLGTLFFM